MADDLVSKVKSASGTAALAYVPVAVALSMGPETFVESLKDERTAAATGLILLTKLGYDAVVKPSLYWLYDLAGWS